MLREVILSLALISITIFTSLIYIEYQSSDAEALHSMVAKHDDPVTAEPSFYLSQLIWPSSRIWKRMPIQSPQNFWANDSAETPQSPVPPKLQVSESCGTSLEYCLEVDQHLIRDLNGSWSAVFSGWWHNNRRLLEILSQPTISSILEAVTRPQPRLRTSAKLSVNRGVDYSNSPDTLIVLTTCNHLRMSILVVSYIHTALSSSSPGGSPVADLVIVDDNSIDGTAAYFRRRGYFVISHKKALGLTHSWNVGYDFAVSHGYSYVFFMNNDVLLPIGAMERIRKDLLGEALIVPMSTSFGCGHNPIQSISEALMLSHIVWDYTDNPRNMQAIQDVLLYQSSSSALGHRLRNRSNKAMKAKGLLPTNVPSVFKKKWRFNGFAFGVNVSAMATIQFVKSKVLSIHQVSDATSKKVTTHPWTVCELLDSSNLMVGQEDELVERMESAGMRGPKLSLGSFLYHFKSYTVDHGSNLRGTIFVGGRSHPPGYIAPLDKRENLTRYHPELRAKSGRNSRLSYGSGVEYAGYFIDDRHKDFIGDRYLIQGKSHGGMFKAAFRLAEIGIPISLVYPATTDEDCRIVIAMAISNPIRNPGAGDIFIAREMEESLKRSYPGGLIEVLYLRKGVDWYDMTKLSRVDVLITLLDDYDLSKALFPVVTSSQASKRRASPHQLYYSVKRNSNRRMISKHVMRLPHRLKSTFLAVAWVRNWFSRWLSRPWLGNYDLILLSSRVAFDYFAAYSEQTGGFASMCISFCPAGPSRTFTRFRDAFTSSSHTFSAVPNVDPTEATGSFRFKVPLGVLRIATNPRRFQPGTGSSKYKADYGFTGSYYNLPRDIQTFDPASVMSEGLKGLIIGNGWATAPNVSQAWKDIAIGGLSYDQMPLVYQSLDIVIDDANHVFKPWGSVNSRVFDAIASGCLPITNGALGSADAFASLLPVYHNVSHLKSLLLQYGGKKNTQKEARKMLVSQLRRLVLDRHTYDKRSLQLGGFLRRYFGLNLMAKGQSSNNMEPQSIKREINRDIHRDIASGHAFTNKSSAICIGIRTSEDQIHELELMMLSLVSQFTLFESDQAKNRLAMKIFVIETDKTSTRFKISLIKLIDRLNHMLRLYPFSLASVLWDAISLERRYHNPFKGYDSTDFLLQHMLADDARNELSRGGCDWIMFTNGDNMYNTVWFDTISSHILDPSVDIVAWDFIARNAQNDPAAMKQSKKSRKLLEASGIAPRLDKPGGQGSIVKSMKSQLHKNGVSMKKKTAAVEQQEQTLTSVAFKRRFISLGSAIVRTHLFLKTNAVFLPDSVFTGDLHSRDFNFLNQIAKVTNPSKIRLIHSCLMSHQYL